MGQDSQVQLDGERESPGGRLAGFGAGAAVRAGHWGGFLTDGVPLCCTCGSGGDSNAGVTDVTEESGDSLRHTEETSWRSLKTLGIDVLPPQPRVRNEVLGNVAAI